ncbi:hypothetical protein PIB30_069658 [Stylosanthes scabra]|uniref:Nucleoplasmin-like domain-containing protein n=1 Tax=Stylosanthes scabra TaxID=79078 RepID=A0ABU6ZLV4_9FABA|nr:hypothetical protein [Stylosanthes scabra]
MVQTANDEEEEEHSDEEEDREDDEWLYELLAKLAEIDSDSEDGYEDAEEEEVTKEDEEKETTESAKETTDKKVGCPNKEEEFFIATVYGGNEENPEDLPEKCDDPRPYFVTCKVGKIYVSDCLCDPGACASIMPLELYKLNFYDETFSLKVGNVIEIFQPTRPPISQEESKGESVVATEPKETAKRAVTSKLKKEKKNPTPTKRSNQKKEDTKAMKKKKPEKEREERKAELNYIDFKDLLGKLKKIKSAIIKDGGIGVHLVEDNSKWK